MADWSLPSLAQTWANFVAAIKGRDESNAKMDYSADSNIPDGTIRFNRTEKKWETWDANTLSWSDLADTYAISVDKVDGKDDTAFAWRSNNLSDLASASTARSNLGAAAAATTITGGTGISGGGSLAANRTLSLDTSHSRNVDHSAVSIVAGNGLTGGGTIATNRTLNVGAGNGISVSADAVAMSGSFTGTFTASGNVRAGSDIKVKERLEPIEDPLKVLAGIRGYRYWRTDLRCHEAGVVAQEVQLALPEAVGYDETQDMLTVAYSQIIAVLVEAVKELQERVDGLAE